MKNVINKKIYMKGRETMNLLQSIQNKEYKATMTCNDYEKNMYYPPLLIITQ